MPPFPPREECKVLILGCGNSTFAFDMLQDGWKGHITNVDFSRTVIEQMQEKYKSYSEFMDFVCVDITNGLPFEDKTIDLIICKGTFDALLTSAGSVANAKFVVSECSRLLANGHGILFLVTFGNPDARIVFLEGDGCDGEGCNLHFYWSSVE